MLIAIMMGLLIFGSAFAQEKTEFEAELAKAK
jgi:hypothetical protein